MPCRSSLGTLRSTQTTQILKASATAVNMKLMPLQLSATFIHSIDSFVNENTETNGAEDDDIVCTVIKSDLS